MADTAEDHDLSDTMTAWRYWHIPRHRGRPRNALHNVNPKDRTVWVRGITHAVCRHNPTHTPPARGCTCGIYAMGAADIQFASATHYHAADQFQRLAELGEHGSHGLGFSAAELAKRDDEYVRDLYGWAHHYQSWDVIIGRIQLHNPVQHQRPPDKPGQLRCWRGGSALLEALYISDRTRDAGPLRATLSGKYGVPCDVGYPAYTQADWDNRTQTEKLDPRNESSSWAQVGLYPPGKTAPRRFFTATVPPGQDLSKRLQTWTEQT
ncbi:hypothetical protein [Mycobacterium parascrofulaceum]|nr:MULTISPECIES: hypothetical protein [Mycobacterium]OCB62291.1 hypothetical protein A9X02_05580 [Mycobacterium malmoense]